MTYRKILDVGKKLTTRFIFKYVVKIQFKTLAKNFMHVKKFICRKFDTKYLEKIGYLWNKFFR